MNKEFIKYVLAPENENLDCISTDVIINLLIS